jgi:N-acetylglutamate synthase-like GNAT family acetyltransferase
MEFRFAGNQDLNRIQALLQSAGLPYQDIEEHLHSFILASENSKLLGCAGLEIYDGLALLRSVAVEKEMRNKGVGSILTKKILAYAQEQNIHQIFLLTTTASSFFQQLGFAEIDRDTAPSAIRSTKEFSSICPSSSVLMSKLISS